MSREEPTNKSERRLFSSMSTARLLPLIASGLWRSKGSRPWQLSKIETWWLQFDDLRTRMMRRNAAFASVVATKSKSVLGRLFDSALFSTDSLQLFLFVFVHAAGYIEQGQACHKG